MEYLGEVQFYQPVTMWINQLEKDKDVVAQAQAITFLEALPQLTSPVVHALSNFLNDSKAFWRIRIQAAYALATTACEENDWAGLLHLIKFYKSKRFDPNIGLPRPNDFIDFQEYFVLEAIPHAIAVVRSSDKKSPREAVEFILQILKYNDNSGNPYSDVFWVAALVQSVGELEFGEQTITYLTSFLKRLDRLLQFESLMPSHNGILTVSCIQALTQIAIKLSEFLPLGNMYELINPYRASKKFEIRVAASRSLLELEFHFKGTDAALALLFKYIRDEASLRGQTKLALCTLRLCQIACELDSDNSIKSETLVALLRLLESPLSFNNIHLRHYVFCILLVLARRAPTFYGVPRDETLRMGHTKTSSQLKDIFAALIKQSKTTTEQPELPVSSPLAVEGYVELTDALKTDEVPSTIASPAPDASVFTSGLQIVEGDGEKGEPESHLPCYPILLPDVQMPAQDQQPTDVDAEGFRTTNVVHADHQQIEPVIQPENFGPVALDAANEPVTLPKVGEPKKMKLKIRVKKQPVTPSHAEDQGRMHIQPEDQRKDGTLIQDQRYDGEHGASSSVSVDAPHRNLTEAVVSTSNQNAEDANSCQDVGSRVAASIGSARPVNSGEEQQLVTELQCTADSSKISLPVTSEDGNVPMANAMEDEAIAVDHVEDATVKDMAKKKEKKRKKIGNDEDHARKEHKRQKEKKRKEKEMAKLLAENQRTEAELPKQETGSAVVNMETETPGGAGVDPGVGQGITKGTQQNLEVNAVRVDSSRSKREGDDASGNIADGSVAAAPTVPSIKLKIKFKNRTLGRP